MQKYNTLEHEINLRTLNTLMWELFRMEQNETKKNEKKKNEMN